MNFLISTFFISNSKTHFNVRITISIHSISITNLTLKTPTIRFKITTNFITRIFIPNILKSYKMKSRWIIEVTFKCLHITTSSSTPSKQVTCNITTSTHSRLSNIHIFIEVFHSRNLLSLNTNSILTNSTIRIVISRSTKQSTIPTIWTNITIRKFKT